MRHQNLSESYEASMDEMFKDQGLARCDDCNQWYRPDGRDLHPGCPTRATDLRITISTPRS